MKKATMVHGRLVVNLPWGSGAPSKVFSQESLESALVLSLPVQLTAPGLKRSLDDQDAVD